MTHPDSGVPFSTIPDADHLPLLDFELNKLVENVFQFILSNCISIYTYIKRILRDGTKIVILGATFEVGDSKTGTNA